MWCAFAGTNRIFQADVAKVKDYERLEKEIVRGSGIKTSQTEVWKVRARAYHIFASCDGISRSMILENGV